MKLIKHLSGYKNTILFFAICWTLLLTVLSLFSLKNIPKPSYHSFDKIGHAFFYMILSFLWMLFIVIIKKPNKAKRLILLCAIILFIYGIIIEIFQEIMPFNRTADWYDVVANAIGILLTLIAINIFLWKDKQLKTLN